MLQSSSEAVDRVGDVVCLHERECIVVASAIVEIVFSRTDCTQESKSAIDKGQTNVEGDR